MNLLLLLALAQSAAATVEGTAVDSSTGTPIAGVQLRLTQYSGDPAPYGAASGEDGRFRISGVAAGPYWLIGEANGYLLDLFAQGFAPLPLRPGARMKVVVKLARRSVISGRVWNEEGKPLAGAQILFAVPYRDLLTSVLREQVFRGAGDTSTNALGEYRLSLPPGHYRMSAASGRYELDQEVPVEIAAGRERSNVNLRLRRRIAFSISGRVTPGGRARVRANGPECQGWAAT